MIPPSTKANLRIDYSLCRVCSRCLASRACRVKAVVRIDRDEPPYIDLHRCHGCMLCTIECPFGAIKNS